MGREAGNAIALRLAGAGWQRVSLRICSHEHDLGKARAATVSAGLARVDLARQLGRQHRPGGKGWRGHRTPKREEVSPIDPLRVLRILDFEPRRRDAIIVVPPKTPLRDDPFEIALADFPKQIDTTPVDVMQVEQPRHHAWHDGPEPSL